MKSYLKISVLGLSLLASSQSYADQFHYRNLTIGDRAIGLGGAFGAISDDASGLYYNPAGIAFTLSNDISGSANAINTKKVVYKQALGDQDFEEHSGGLTPSFFGVMQKLDHISNGLVFAAGTFTLDNEQQDQDTLVDSTAKVPLSTADGQEAGVYLHRYHRTVNQRGSSFYAGGALAKRFGNNFAVGLGFNYVNIDELVQEYQDTKSQQYTGDTASEFVSHLSSNLRQSVLGYGGQFTLGVQYSFLGRFSLGFTTKFGFWASDRIEIGIEKRVATMAAADAETLSNTGSVTSGVQVSQVAKTGDENVTKGPLGSMPAEHRLAFAWFASTRSLLSIDITHHGEVTDAAEIPVFGRAIFNKEAVTNYAAGFEYYLLPAIPVRLGAFTNYDARPAIDHSKSGQSDHVDYLGGSVFLAWVQPNSQIAAGVVFQNGTGEAQKLGNQIVQEVEGNVTTIAVSATNSL